MGNKSIWAVIALVVILVFFVAGFQAAYTDSSEPHTVTNETITVDYSTPQQVDSADIAWSFADDETVYNSDGEELAEGSDYEWNTSTGEVDWQTSNSTTDGEEATITYTYFAPPEDTRKLAGLIMPVLTALPWLFLGFAGLVAVRLATEGWM